MQEYVGVIVLCTLSGILSCAIHEAFNKDRFDTGKDKPKSNKDISYINHLIKTMVFYAIMFYVILSLFKILLGNGTLALIESFDEVSWRTYLHYSVPLVILSIVGPFILRKLLREKTDDFVLMALSLVIGIYSIVYLIFDRINNIWCVCLYILSITLTLLITYFYKDGISYCTRKSLKKRFKIIVPIISFWIILIMLYLPNELYFGNIEDMAVPYSIFLVSLLVGALIYFIVYTFILVYFLTGKQFSLICEFIFAVSIGCFAQEMFLNGKMSVMDGSVQTWDALTTLVNAFVWGAIIGIVIALRFFIKKNLDKTYSMVCIYLSLIQLVTWGYLGVTTQVSKETSNFQLTTEARLELDSEHNVIVFVLDWFDGQILDRVIANNEDENFIEPLKDFTWYKNMTSLYAYTGMSLPYMLTDVEWQYDMTNNEYRNYAFQTDTYLYDIADRNYDIGVYTLAKYVSGNMADVIRNYSDITTSGWKYFGIFEQILKCSKYKSYPFILKGRYWYADGALTQAMQKNGVHSTSYDQPFYDDLLYNRIQVMNSEKYEGAFRFYHLRGMHTPFEPDIISQGEYCMNIVYEYLEQLKELGLYDEATIIITADHGHNYILKEELLDLYDFDKASSPILFVKKSGQTNEDGPEISMAPVSHAELAATIIEAVCGDTLGYGNTFDDIDENSERERYFIYRRHDDIPYTKYAINGYARDWSNWSIADSNE